MFNFVELIFIVLIGALLIQQLIINFKKQSYFVFGLFVMVSILCVGYLANAVL